AFGKWYAAPLDTHYDEVLGAFRELDDLVGHALERPAHRAGVKQGLGGSHVGAQYSNACGWPGDMRTAPQPHLVETPILRCRDYGQGGIRTHETLATPTPFPAVRLRPLGHLSIGLESSGYLSNQVKGRAELG